MMKHLHHVGVTSDNPGMKVRIPMNGILTAQAVIERIRIRQHLRIEEVVEAEIAAVAWNRSCAIGGCDGGHPLDRRCHTAIPSGSPLRMRCASSSVMAASLARIRDSISDDISRMVGWSNKLRRESSTPNV